MVTLGFPVVASASSSTFYDVAVDATVLTTYTGAARTATIDHQTSLSTSTEVKATFLASIERDAAGRIVGASGEEHHTATTTGTSTTHEREFASQWNDWWERDRSCVGAGQNKNDVGRTSVRPDPLTPLVGASLTLNLADTLLVGLTCSDTGRHGGAGPGSFVIESAVSDDPADRLGPLATTFSLPPEATSAGKVIQFFEGPAAGEETYCPEALADQEHRMACRVSFRGTISLTKVELGGPAGPPVSDVLPPALPIVPSGAGPTGGVISSRRPSVPSTQRLRLAGRGSRFSFRAACAGGCSGSATIRVPAASSSKSKSKSMRRVAVVRVAVPKGLTTKSVRVMVPRAARRTLDDTRGAVVDLELRDRANGRTTKTRLKLR